jgi:hypothetical protein
MLSGIGCFIQDNILGKWLLEMSVAITAGAAALAVMKLRDLKAKAGK